MMLEKRIEVARKKQPRVFSLRQSSALARGSLKIQWPEKSWSEILEISESGITTKKEGLLVTLKSGQVLPVRIWFNDQEIVQVQARVFKVTSSEVELGLDQLSPLGRLRVPQDVRENMITAAWQLRNPEILGSEFADSTWFHSAFDSNIWIWQDSSHMLRKLIVEFESVVLILDANGGRFLKSPSSAEESFGYVGGVMSPLPHRVEPGHNWKERFRKVLGSPHIPKEVQAWVLGYV